MEWGKGGNVSSGRQKSWKIMKPSKEARQEDIFIVNTGLSTCSCKIRARDVITASLFDTNVQEVDTPTLSEHDFVELLMVQKKQMITAIGAMTNEHPAKRNALLYGVEHITEPEESAASA